LENSDRPEKIRAITSSASGWTSGNDNIDVWDNDASDDCPDCSGDAPVVKDVTFKQTWPASVRVKRASPSARGKIEKGVRVTFKAPR